MIGVHYEQALLEAAQSGDMSFVQEHIQYAHSARDTAGWSALMHTIDQRHVVLANVLMRQVPELMYVRAANGCTPLSCAINRNMQGIALYLIGENACLDCKVISHTHLDLATISRDAVIVRALLHAAAQNERLSQVFSDASVVYLAAERGCHEILELLLAHGYNVNAVASTGHRTALHVACSEGHLDTAACLIAAGAALVMPWKVVIKVPRKDESAWVQPILSLLLSLCVEGALRYVEALRVVSYCDNKYMRYSTDEQAVESCRELFFGYSLTLLRKKIESIRLHDEISPDMVRLVMVFVAAREDLMAALRFVQKTDQEDMLAFLKSLMW